MEGASTAQEAFLSFRSYPIWSRILDDQGAVDTSPLLCLHGRFGTTYDYLEASGGAGAGRMPVRVLPIAQLWKAH